MFLESLPINIFFQKYDDAFVEEVEDSGFKVQAESFQGTDRIAFYNLGIHGVGKTSWRDELKFTRQRGSRRAFCACTNVRRTGMWLSRRGRWERRSNGGG